MSDIFYKTLFALAVSLQVVSGLGILTALVLIYLHGTGVISVPI